MMSPEAQLVNPFFLGGSQIIVSYPTDTMDYDARMQSMRGNNPGFSHATAFHEMIPGHNLVGYINQRYADYRAGLTGGGAVLRRGLAALLGADAVRHGLPQDARAEGRRAVLAHAPLRAHHLLAELPHGQLDAAGVHRLPRRPRRARARQRDGGSAPLVSRAATARSTRPRYLLGGLQLRGLRRELVDSKVMTNKQFHDEIMRQGNMPIALIRLAVTQREADARHGHRLEVLRRPAGQIVMVRRQSRGRGGNTDAPGSRAFAIGRARRPHRPRARFLRRQRVQPQPRPGADLPHREHRHRDSERGRFAVHGPTLRDARATTTDEIAARSL